MLSTPQRRRRAFVTMVVVSFAVLASLSYVIYSNRHLAEQGQEAHDALCVLKYDLRRRIRATREFLKSHPDGVPGFPASTFQTSIVNQQKTLRSFKVLDCVPPPDEAKKAV